jgi:hypothetical protein
VSQLQFAEDVLARIRARGGQYHERGYLFVLATIEYLQSRPRRGATSAAPVRPGLSRLARSSLASPARFGTKRHPHRGLRRIVFTLVEVGLQTQPGDAESD